MAMLKIWGRKNSVNVKKALWCAEELALPYDQIDAGGAFGKVSEPEYKKLNPNELVPTLEDNGFVVWESNTIVRYLAARYGDGSLYPTDVQKRAAAEQWMDWATSSVAAPFRDVFWNMIRTAAPDRDMAAVASGIARCSRLFAIADSVLRDRAYLSGDDLTVSDIAVGPFVYTWFAMPIEHPNLPHLRAWYERLAKRPAFIRTVMHPLT